MRFIEFSCDPDPLHSVCDLDRRTFLAVAYLLLPNLIFLVGWFLPALAWPLSALGGWIAWHMARDAFRGAQGIIDWRLLLVIVVLAAGWTMLGGAGHFFYANRDWLVRDAVLGDLVFGAWPVAYEVPGQDVWLLRSAMGYYLPAALIGKLLGIAWVDLALYAWTTLGVAIFFLLLPLPRRSLPWLILFLLMVVFYSGMDILGAWVNHDVHLLHFFPNSIDWWVPYSYPSPTGLLFWTPNHALPIWILTALFYRHWAHPEMRRVMLFALPLSLIWTPFAAAGVFPFMCLAFVSWWRKRQVLKLNGQTIVLVVFGAVLGYLSVRFITMDIEQLPVHILGKVDSANRNLAKFFSPSVKDYLVFVEMEFGILALALLPTLRHSFGVYGVAVAMLLALPLATLGPSKDTMRLLSTAPLMILLMLVMSNWQAWTKARSYPASVYVIGIVLLVGMPTAIYDMGRSLLWKRTPPNYQTSLREQQGGHLPPHYGARLNRPDIKWLMKSPQLVPAASQRGK